MSDLVPVIDISPFASSDPAARQAVAAAVDDAFRNIGFLVISGHGIPDDVVSRAQRVAIEFFSLPDTDKQRYVTPRKSIFRGYNGVATQRSGGLHNSGKPADLRENYMMSRIDVADPYFRRPEFGDTYAPNFWPEQPAEYQEAFEALYAEMEALSFRMARICGVALGMHEEFFLDKVDRHSSTCVANFYPAQKEEPLPGQVRAGAHADVGSLTFLITDRAKGGLQVLGKDEAWHDVVTAPGQIIINVGDLLGRWTNDRWVSTKHQVVNPPREYSNTHRLSLSFFQHPNFDAEVACIPSCTGPGNPPKYEPVLAGEQMHKRMMRAREWTELDAESLVPATAGVGRGIDTGSSAIGG